MKNWKYIVKSSSKEVIKKLNSAFNSAGGFNFKADNDSASFKIKKPVNYPDQILHRNRLVVDGKISSTNDENETHVEIKFTQDFYMKMTVFSIIVAGGILIALISKAFSGTSLYLLVGLVFIVGFLLWNALKKKLDKDAQNYKSLISEILES